MKNKIEITTESFLTDINGKDISYINKDIYRKFTIDNKLFTSFESYVIGGTGYTHRIFEGWIDYYDTYDGWEDNDKNIYNIDYNTFVYTGEKSNFLIESKTLEITEYSKDILKIETHYDNKLINTKIYLEDKLLYHGCGRINHWYDDILKQFKIYKYYTLYHLLKFKK